MRIRVWECSHLHRLPMDPMCKTIETGWPITHSINDNLLTKITEIRNEQTTFK